MSFGSNSYLDGSFNLMDAFQQMANANMEAASIQSAALAQVSDAAKAVAQTNVSYLQQTAGQSQQMLAPFIAAGASSTTALQNLLGVNGIAAQQQAAQGIIGSATGSLQNANNNTLNQMFGLNLATTGNGNTQSSVPTAPVKPGAVPTAQYSPEAQQQVDSVKSQMANLQAQGAAAGNWGMPDNSQYQQWQQLQQQLKGIQPSNQQAITQVQGQQQSYQQQLQQYNSNLSAYQAQGSNSPTQGTSAPATGGGLSGMMQPAQNIANMDPVKFAQSLNQQGITQAQDATNAYLNNGVVTQSMDALNRYGQQGVQNSAASNGMLNSGKTLTDLYQMGSGLAGQYLIPQITSLSNQIIGANQSAGNSALNTAGSAAGGLANNATQLAATQLSGNAGVAGQALGQTTGGLSNIVTNATNAANTGASVLGNLGTGVANQNSNAANTVANATMGSANAQSQALLNNANLQFSLSSMMQQNPSAFGNSGLGQTAGFMGGMAGLAGLVGMIG